jgi:hypothetical protein
MAGTGYGKRLAGDEDPDAEPDFAHLLPRDAEGAVFIDHLDTGHARGHKVLAAEHPRYGRQVMCTSLTRIARPATSASRRRTSSGRSRSGARAATPHAFARAPPRAGRHDGVSGIHS